MTMEIPKAKELEQEVFSVQNEEAFGKIALRVFNFQYLNNPLYQQYCNRVYRTPASVQGLFDIPFLPISFFKSHEVRTTEFDPALVFESSGTTGVQTSRHFVRDAGLYEQSFLKGFELFFGDASDYTIIGLLPSYLERKNSSLVYMADVLVKKSGREGSGFYLYNYDELSVLLKRQEAASEKTILIGVSFALLDFAAQFPMQLKHSIIVETGGMKGRQKEITRAELNSLLKSAFGLPAIHSEYGMTELLSQAWGLDGLFKTPPWMKVLLREETDPFAHDAVSGAINIIDLANLYSCSFIATDDLGKLRQDGSFEVLGRLDQSDVRGCSQLAI